MGMKEIKPGLWKLDVSVWQDCREYRWREDFGGGKRAAEARKAEIKAELRNRAKKESCSFSILTFREALSFYLERNPAGRSMPYFARLMRDLGNVPLHELKVRFDRWLMIVQREKGENTGRPICSGTVNRYIAWSKAALNFCCRFDLIQENPLKHIGKLEERPRDRYLTAEERIRLFNAIRDTAPYLEPFVRFSMAVPCRKGELTGLKREAFNAFTNTVYVPDSKNGSPIYKPVPPDMVSYFRNLPPGCEWLFYRKDKNGFHPLGDFKNAWKTCLKVAKLSDVRVHDLRHCAATDLYAAGNSERSIMDIAGWRTPMLSVYRKKDSLKSAQSMVFPGETRQTTRQEKIASLGSH